MNAKGSPFSGGVKTHEFPVFETTNFVANQGTAFRVHGVVNDAPHLHKALDEAYQFRLENSGADYPYRYFDIVVEFTHALGKFDAHHLVYSDTGGEDFLIPSDVKPIKTLHYSDCQVSDYLIDTVFNSYRSYGHAETGRLIAVFYMFFGITILRVSLSVISTRYYNMKYKEEEKMTHGQKLILDKN